MSRERIVSIDIVRGVAMLAMVITHATAYFVKAPNVFWVWNISQFAVTSFVFTSSYLFFKSPSQHSLSALEYVKARLSRLLGPYWWYLAALVVLALLKGESVQPLKWLRLATLTTSSNDPGWLVLLFLELSIVSPLFWLLYTRARWWFYFAALICFTTSILALDLEFSLNFKLTMWMPWSVVVLSAWHLARYENVPQYRTYFITGWGLVFVTCLIYIAMHSRSLSMYEHKYPPDLFHLSWGLLVTGLLLTASRARIFSAGLIYKLLMYLSLNSYTIYFIHFIILNAFINFMPQFVWKVGWAGFAAVLLTTTLLAQEGLNKLHKSIAFRH